MLCLNAASAAVLMEEGFNYPTGTALGSQSPWIGTSSATLQVVPGDLIWAGLPDTVPSGNVLQVGSGASAMCRRNFAASPVTNGSVYLSMLINCTALPTNSQHIASLLSAGASSANGGDDPMAFYLANGTNGFVLSISHHGESSRSSKIISTNETHLIVMKYTFGGSDRCSFYIDPPPGHGEPATPDAITPSGEGDPSPNLQVLALLSPGTAVLSSWTLDTLRVGTEWADVTPWPIPVSLSGLPNPQVCPGDSAVFVVSALGTAPFTYQWRTNGNPIANATDSTYTVPNAGPSDTLIGYDVIVTNAYGFATSRVANITLRTLPGIVTPPVSQVLQPGATNVTFRVAANGTGPLSYQWRANGSPLPGATRSTLSLTNPAVSVDPVAFDVIVTNACGSVTNIPAAQLFFPHPFLLADALPGFFGGMNLFTTNVAGMNLYAWSSVDPGQSITNWTLEGPLSEQPLNDGTGNSRYSLNVNPAASPTYYLIGESTAWPYLSPASVAWLTTDPENNFTLLTATVTIQADGTLLFPTGPALTGPANASICSGDPALFSVTAQGTPPFTYQWLTNGLPVAGATGSSLGLANPNSTDALRAYSVLVTDYFGPSTSRLATLSIRVAPAVTTPPSTLVLPPGPTNVTFQVLAAGTSPLTYQWRTNGVNVAGATSSSLVLTNPGPSAETLLFDVVISNACGAVSSSPPAQLIFLHAFLVADGLPGFFGGMNLFTTNGPGMNLFVWSSTDPLQSVTNWTPEGPLAEQPLNDGTGNSRYSINVNPIVSPTYYIIGETPSGPYLSPAPVATVTTDGFGNYSLTIMNVNIGPNGVLDYPMPPSIVSQPLSRTVTAGKNVTLSASAAGKAPLTYQWYFNASTALPNATNANLTLTRLTMANAGNYTLVVSNANGGATSDAAILIVLPPPALSIEPTSLGFQITWTGMPGDIYWVQATTNLNPPVAWSTLATNVADASGTIRYLDLNSPTFPKRYYRLASPLAAPAEPVILTQPVSQTILAGKTVSFNCRVAGVQPVAYQWLFNSAPVTDSTNSSLNLSGLVVAQTGDYSVTVTNSFGIATSAEAHLTVLPIPRLDVLVSSKGLQFTSTAIPGNSYWLQSTTNLIPPASWVSIATNTADANGLVQFTTPKDATLVLRFFRLVAP